MSADPMLRALDLAAGHRTHPNPRVGAVVVKDGSIVGEGFHEGPGTSHAEVVALSGAGPAARGADLYVTLEPCSHHGRTPPCVEAVVDAGVARVIVGVEDPDRRVSGKGIAFLESSGIEVSMWEHPNRAEAVDPAYFRHRRTGMPRVVAKYAMTLDGSAAAADTSSQWITSPEARADAHMLRSRFDGILVGAGTIRVDDPKLDVRLDGYSGAQPRPVILAGVSPLPETASIWQRNPVVVAPSEVSIPAGELLVVSGEGALPDPGEAARALAGMGLLDLLLEGGPTLLGAWWAAGVVERVYAYVAAKVGGGAGIPPLGGVFRNITEARDVVIVDVQTIGPDVRIEFQ